MYTRTTHFHLGRVLRMFMAYTLGLFLASATALASAQTVTAEQVANAIRNSPNASAWLKENADAVGALAMFESGGRLDVYNGSCCSGILQMNQRNIRKYADTTPEDFRQWSLQDQVNAWSQLTSEMVETGNPRRLIAAGTFDGRQVDGHLVLSCVQLGVGNCGRMIASGSCDGFRDSNGTSICDMADTISGGVSNPSTGNPGEGDTGDGHIFVPPWDLSGLNVGQGITDGFASGSGVSMERLRAFIMMLLAATTFIVIGDALLGLWRRYVDGSLVTADLLHYWTRGFIVVGLVFVLMLLF